MDYKPRYSHPFTLTEVTVLDVSVISEEISRLQNSLKHLRETQETLKTALTETTEPPDAEIAEAFEENQIVIGSQEERITILNMALAEKGIISGSHYDPNYDPTTPEVSRPLTTQANPSHTITSFTDTALSNIEEDGVYL